MVNQAKNLVSKNLKVCDKVYVGGTMLNSQEEVIRLYKTHNFAGTFKIKPSANINKTGPGEFLHEGDHFPIPPFPHNAQSMLYGSRGAIVYGNYVLEGEANNVGIVRGYLLAWSVLDNKHHVYVEAGPLEKIMNLDMTEVEQKLMNSGTTSYYWDRSTGTEAKAAITPQGNTAALGSAFGVKLLGPVNY